MPISLHPARIYVIGGALVLATGALSFFSGRASVKPEVRTEVVTREVVRVEQRTVYKDRVKHKTTTKKPDGTVVIVEDTRTTTTGTSSTATTDTSSSAVSVKSYVPQWKVSALAGFDLGRGSLVYGGAIDRRILGPLSLGVWAHAGVRSNPVVGGRLTLEF